MQNYGSLLFCLVIIRSLIFIFLFYANMNATLNIYIFFLIAFQKVYADISVG